MLYFEDIEVEDKFSAGPYLLEAGEIKAFARQWDPFKFHMDDEVAAASIYGGLTAPGVLSLCISNRLCHDFEAWAILAMFGAEYRLPNPARVEDKLTLERVVISKRESRSRPDAGIVESEDTLSNQDGSAVLVQRGSVLVGKKRTVA